MSKEEGGLSPLFLDNKSIREILEKASKSLFFSPSEEVVEEAVQLIEAMKEDLIRLHKLPITAEPFKSHDSLSLEEIDKIYEKSVNREESESFITPHTIN